ncbi:MAG: zinc ribbon domain-containing protein [Anaerolineales bacterium]|nr:zinc ribbon domain-containing protein [Anaerolineales bacterium]
MKNTWKWIIGIVVGLVVLGLLFGLPFLYRTAYGFESYARDAWMPMHSYPMHGGFMPVGGFFMWLFPLGLLVLTGLGIAWLIRSLSAGRVPARVCSQCGRAAQIDWKTCPYCSKEF